MKRLAFVLGFVGILAAPLSASAGTGVADMKNSLSFGVPNGGNNNVAGAAGVWMMMDPSTNVGFNVGLAGQTGGSLTWDLILGPKLRYYLAQTGPVLPYGHAQVNIRLFDNGASGAFDDIELGAAGGIGTEWFVTDVFSLAAEVGLGIDLMRPGNGMSWGTFTSAVSAQLYY